MSEGPSLQPPPRIVVKEVPPIPYMKVKSLDDYGYWKRYISKGVEKYWLKGRPTNELLWIRYKLEYLRLIRWEGYARYEDGVRVE